MIFWSLCGFSTDQIDDLFPPPISLNSANCAKNIIFQKWNKIALDLHVQKRQKLGGFCTVESIKIYWEQKSEEAIGEAFPAEKEKMAAVF